MSVFRRQLLALKEAIFDQNYHKQRRIVCQIVNCIEQSNHRQQIIQEFLAINLAGAINDVVCTKLHILQPSVKLIRYLMDDHHFRTYLFLPILKNILRSLIFFVQSDEMEKSQLEFFDVVAILDILIKKFLSNNVPHKPDDDMQATFMCILKFVELVLFRDCVESAVKNLMVEIYLHLLNKNGIFNCFNASSFEVVIKVANIGEEFLDRFVAEYEKDRNELWLYKILQVLFRIFESFVINGSNLAQLAVRVFEKLFIDFIIFVLEQMTLTDPTAHNPQLFKHCISILNTVLWTPVFSQSFYTKILKAFVKINGDLMVICMSKSSKKIANHTTYTMKILLTALTNFSANSPYDKHGILYTFLHCRLFNSIVDVKPHDVLNNHKAVILLYGCSFLRQRFTSPLSAHGVLENVLLILNHPTSQLDDDEMWSVLTIFSFCSHYAELSVLEYAGVQRTVETIFEQISRTMTGMQRWGNHIDKYIVSLVNTFSTSDSFSNFMGNCRPIFQFVQFSKMSKRHTFSINFAANRGIVFGIQNLIETSVQIEILQYLSQQPSLTSSKVRSLIPTHSILPLLISSDHNQVENALKLLQRKHLTEEDLSFVVDQCFDGMKADEIIIGAALNLIGTNLCLISNESTNKIYMGSMAFLEGKQVTSKFSKQCYLNIVKICANLVMFKQTVSH